MRTSSDTTTALQRYAAHAAHYAAVADSGATPEKLHLLVSSDYAGVAFGDTDSVACHSDAASGDGPAAPTPTGSREAALLFLQEAAFMARSLAPLTRDQFFRALVACGGGAPTSTFWATFDGVLSDRHATEAEVAAALDVLTATVANDATALRELRDHVERSGARFRGGAAFAPPDAATTATTEKTAAADASAAGMWPHEAIVDAVSRHAYDDGASIRPYEKLRVLAIAGDLDLLIPGAPGSNAGRAFLTRFNELQRSAGEHGLLITDAAVRSTPLPLKLAWRAVDDPSIAIQAAALELLRIIFDSNPAAVGSYVPEQLMTHFFDDGYLRALMSPFLHPMLPPLTSPGSPAAAAAMAIVAKADSDGGDAETRLKQQGHSTGFRPLPRALTRECAEALAPGFSTPGAVGRESASSKASKLAIVGLYCSLIVPQSTRVKYFALRCRLLGRLLRLARYPERHMVLAAVRVVRTSLETRDIFWTKRCTDEFAFAPLLAALLLNDRPHNLLSSAMLELFTFIAASGESTHMRSVAENLVQQYEPLLSRIRLPDGDLVSLLRRCAAGVVPSAGTFSSPSSSQR